ncbi:MAG: cold shock domain-containing protein [Pseudomonadota bacterium]
MNGVIVWYNPSKRYGFVAPQDGGGDIFFRLDDAGIRDLGPVETGMNVHFLLAEGPDGPVAMRLAPGNAPEPPV